MQINKYERICYLTYHRLSCQLTESEITELLHLILEWKNEFDQREPNNKGSALIPILTIHPDEINPKQ